VFSKPEQPDIPSKELTERRKYLQRRFEEREYARMVGDCGDGSMQVRGSAAVKAQSGRGASVGEDMHALRGAMSTAVNMVAAVAASFAVGYYAGKGTDGTQRTGFLFGLAGAIIVLVVEMALFIIRALREERLAANKDK
jgi:predicted cobalt transporter CbtA